MCASRSVMLSNRSLSTKSGGGSNCCIVGCPCTSTRCLGLSFHKLPRPGINKEQDEWRAKLIHAIGRCDKSFNPLTAKICSRHFEESCIRKGPSGTCIGLVPGSLPTRWMPQKSVVTPKTTRSEPKIREPPVVPVKICYSSLMDLKKDLIRLPPNWTVLRDATDILVLGLLSGNEELHVRVRFSASTGLKSNVSIFQMPAPWLGKDLEIMKLPVFLKELSEMTVCSGVTETELQSLAESEPTGCSYFRHITYAYDDGKMLSCSCVRAVSCRLLLNVLKTCENCVSVRKTLQAIKSRQESCCTQAIKPNDPLRAIPYNKLKDAFRQVRKEKTMLEKDLVKFKKQLKDQFIEIEPAISDSLKKIDCSAIEDPLQKLFWQEQKLAFEAANNGHRWHPMMLRFAILLHSKSKSSYEMLRSTGVLKLPGSSTLREYIHAVRPAEGFQPEVVEELRNTAIKLSEDQRFVVLLHDEMSIKSDLVFDRRSGELVGFINKEKWQFDFNYQTDKLATQALVFYVVGINSSLKMSIGFFGTRSATADELYPLFWQAAGVLESCGLKVVISTCDKAPANQRLYQMHAESADVCFKTVNMFAPNRYIFFISDPPHLIKTIRNNLANSGITRFLWKDGQHLLWRHVSDLYNHDISNGLSRTKLTYEHLHLTPHSMMNVRLAAQVLSNRVGVVMREYGSPDSQETSKFILFMDRFFDCLNVRNLYEAQQKRKPDLLPYRSVNDARFQFLEEFLEYLQSWKQSVESRPGNFSASERKKMILSHQTYRGIVMTVRSFIEVTRYLLTNGVDFVLSGKFSQDPLEQHFGRHRAIGRGADNPNLHQFGYQETKLRLQRSLAIMVQPRGNVEKTDRIPATITTSPLKKRPRN